MNLILWKRMLPVTISLSSSHHSCLHQICNMIWPNIMTNENLLKTNNSNCKMNRIKQMILRWIGHVFRMEKSQITEIVLRWTPPGKRPRETMWCGTVECELNKLKMTWKVAKSTWEVAKSLTKKTA